MRAVGVLLLAVGCFKPVPPEGRPCAEPDDDCPVGLSCFGGLCVSHPGDSGIVPIIDAQLDGPVTPDADPSCHCNHDELDCGNGEAFPCALGCSEPQDLSGGHCLQMVPSNGVDRAFVDEVSQAIELSDPTTMDTDTGAMTGGFSRAAGTGVIAGIGFHQAIAPGGAPLGVFVFHGIQLDAGTSIKLSGSRAAVFLVATTASIAGTIDGSGGCDMTDPSCSGPGGGTGGTALAPATGCGPGGDGVSGAPGAQQDGGGGGGGGGLVGAQGGGEAGIAPGGAAGSACLAGTLEPLVGGSGGGTGGGGSVARQPGGGGGGALQISSLGALSVTGTITMVGAGGSGGPPAVSANAGAGAGGGAGGGILLEAPSLTLGASVTLTCNGGGGGSGGSATMSGLPGAPGTTTTLPANGGNQIAAQAGKGGDGGAVSHPATSGDSKANGGGGGAGVGAIHLRAVTPPMPTSGTLSPQPTARTITTS